MKSLLQQKEKGIYIIIIMENKLDKEVEELVNTILQSYNDNYEMTQTILGSSILLHAIRISKIIERNKKLKNKLNKNE
jgi:hypothetical protein